MRNVHTLESVKLYFEQSGCELLTKEYKNSAQKLDYKCKCGKENKVTYQGFLNRKVGCRQCIVNETKIEKVVKTRSKPRKITYELVKQEFENAGCKLISKEYVSNSKKLQYVCSCGNTSEKTYNCFQYKKGCMECTGTPKYTMEHVKDIFKEAPC